MIEVNLRENFSFAFTYQDVNASTAEFMCIEINETAFVWYLLTCAFSLELHHIFVYPSLCGPLFVQGISNSTRYMPKHFVIVIRH